MNQEILKTPQVAIIRGNSPIEGVINGINKLKGISEFIDDGDQVFIKFNLRLPYGFPANTNFDVLEAVIKLCKKAGAKRICIGGFPFSGITIKSISDILGIKKYFENIGAELIFLDNSNLFSQKGLKPIKLKLKKKLRFTKYEFNKKGLIFPKIVLDSNKVISVNQVNVDPLFECRLSLLNLYSLIPNNYQNIENIQWKGKDFLLNDQYKQDLEDNIVDAFSIKKPDLVINDLFYILEQAGPYAYKDSNLKKTGIVIVGNDAVAVDAITAKILNLDKSNNNLVLKAEKRGLGTANISKIKVFGENLKDISINIEPCVRTLDEVNLQNFSIKSGCYCSGCFKQAYYLLNIIKTNTIKDLKYITPNNSFLIGEKPANPTDLNVDNIILFGDCAIRSTKEKDFMIKMKKSRKTNKIKANKKILSLKGCPPDIFSSIKSISKYYGKKDTPMLDLYLKTITSYMSEDDRKKLRIWEAQYI